MTRTPETQKKYPPDILIRILDQVQRIINNPDNYFKETHEWGGYDVGITDYHGSISISLNGIEVLIEADTFNHNYIEARAVFANGLPGLVRIYYNNRSKKINHASFWLYTNSFSLRTSRFPNGQGLPSKEKLLRLKMVIYGNEILEPQKALVSDPNKLQDGYFLFEIDGGEIREQMELPFRPSTFDNLL